MATIRLQDRYRFCKFCSWSSSRAFHILLKLVYDLFLWCKCLSFKGHLFSFIKTIRWRVELSMRSYSLAFYSPSNISYWAIMIVLWHYFCLSYRFVWKKLLHDIDWPFFLCLCSLLLFWISHQTQISSR